MWLIITSVYVKLGLVGPLQYVRSLSGLTECIFNIALPYHMLRQKQTFLFTVNVYVCGVCGECGYVFVCVCVCVCVCVFVCVCVCVCVCV